MSAPVRHPATEKAWAWLESRPEEEMEPYRRVRIAVTLTELDGELIAMDLATVRMKKARARAPVQRKTLRRSLGQAQSFKAEKIAAGHTDVRITRITPTDWAITWTVKERPMFPPQCETLAGEPKFAEGWADPENPDRLS